MAFDLEARFHETWLGMVQPVEGLVVSIPVMALFYVAQRHLVSGLTSGGVKG